MSQFIKLKDNILGLQELWGYEVFLHHSLYLKLKPIYLNNSIQ